MTISRPNSIEAVKFDSAAWFTVYAARRVLGFGHSHQDPARVLQIALPGLGELNAASRAREKLNVKGRLQLANNASYSGGRQTQLTSGGGQPSLFGDSNEHLHCAKRIHHSRFRKNLFHFVYILTRNEMHHFLHAPKGIDGTHRAVTARSASDAICSRTRTKSPCAAGRSQAGMRFPFRSRSQAKDQ